MADHVKFTMECPDNEGAFLSWTLSALQTPTTLYTLLCIENLHIQTDIGLKFQPSNVSKKCLSFKHSPIGAKMVCSIPEMLAKGMGLPE